MAKTAKTKSGAKFTSMNGGAVSYMEKSEARVVRTSKTTLVEQVLENMVQVHGRVSPETLLEEAKEEEHPLHRYFEWNDTAAAERYRLTQATQMILATRFVCLLVDKRDQRAVDAISHAKKATVRKLLPDYADGGFRLRKDILGEEDGRKMFIDRKLSVLRSWCNSVVDVPELQTMRAAVIELLG